MLPGHVVLDQQGAILEADDSFGSLLMSPVAGLRGRNVLSFTAPADRDECTQAIATLRDTGRPFDITKRFLRQDDSTIWVRNSVSRMIIERKELIVATCTPIAPDHHRRTPELLLESARVQAAMAEARAEIADPVLVSGKSWSLLLQVYIAEGEGRAVSAEWLAARLKLSHTTSQRWINALLAADVLEVETRNLAPNTVKCYRLTATTMQRVEEYLAKFSGYSASHLADA